MLLKVKKLRQDAKIPRYGHKGDAGMDLFAAVGDELAPGEVKAVETGIQLAIPDGHAGLVWDKSGISLAGVHRLAGVIDAGYRGEVKVVMVNLSDRPFVIEPGMKIAQLLVQRIEEMEIVEAENLDETKRGTGGFGSTGKY